MLFNSPIFLFVFLPSLLVLYPLIPERHRNVTLLLYSLVFYYWGSGHLLFLLLVSVTCNYLFGFWLAKTSSRSHKKLALAVGVATNLGLLFYFKYANFVIGQLNSLFSVLDIPTLTEPNILLPIGISFFTFQALSYIIDLYYGRIEIQRSFVDFALYITLFPQLIAGPIVRYSQVAKQFQKRELSSGNYYLGMHRFLLGLGKKIIIADQLGGVADKIFALPQTELSFPVAWIGTVFFALQIFYDFSGYSDMAIGLARVFGFTYLENFNYPYISRSITEFWRRWHISLSTWFRDYLYIPLGGNRVPPLRNYVNLFIVFVLCGLWHGAHWNFLVWGLIHGMLLIFERVFRGKSLPKVPSIIRHGYVLLALCISWVFFRVPELGKALAFLKTMAAIDFSPTALGAAAEYLNPEIVVYFGLAVLFSMPVAATLKRLPAVDKIIRRQPFQFEFARMTMTLLLFFCTMLVFASSSYKAYIYFKF